MTGVQTCALPILSNDVFNDIQNELTSKYGNPDSTSEIYYAGNGRNKLRKVIWHNRNGVIIKLEFVSALDNIGTSTGDSQIYLSYRFTKEFESKLNLKKSIY